MLQVKGLTKIYESKKGGSVKALDNVTLSFPETGMVFLLGRSGSGKSTLLNICGGLDSPTKGEIIVKGRSSKDFAQSDFDSYRNTYVGFIFQEYNILNEFSVEDNIGLALELQGKPKDKAAINALLEQVDLSGYAKRKPNTLSGGQKQRIAIARALVKAPEIIMADEPTGALDSATGRQVLETLKKLSAEKLVLVVSHDREFAETYGDRIIELKDGAVLSDVSKTRQQQRPVSQSIELIGDVLRIKNASDLSNDDFDKIKSFLSRFKSDVLIAGNKKDVDNFKKVSRIGDDGAKEVFADTVEAPVKSYSEEESRFIRSRLPLSRAIKMGFSSLKNKPFRLLLTVLLCTAAFSMFSLVSTMNFYDSRQSFEQSMMVLEDDLLKVEKQYGAYVQTYIYGEEDFGHDTSLSAKFSPEEVTQLSSDLGSEPIGGVKTNYASYNVRSLASDYWNNTLAAFAYIPEDHAMRSRLVGEYPSAANEIAISSYTADMLIACGTYDGNGETLALSSREDLFGKTIVIANEEKVTVTGYIETGEIPAEYQPLLQGEGNTHLEVTFGQYLNDGLHLTAFTSPEGLRRLSSAVSYSGGDTIYQHTYAAVGPVVDGEEHLPDYGTAHYDLHSAVNTEFDYVPVDGAAGDLGENQAIVSSTLFGDLMGTILNEKMSDMMFESEEDYKEFYAYIEDAYALSSFTKWVYPEEGGEGALYYMTPADLDAALNKLLKYAKDNDIDLTLALRLYDSMNNTCFGDSHQFDIAGISMVYSSTNWIFNVYLHENASASLWEEQKGTVPSYSITTSEYTDSPDAEYDILYMPYTYSDATVEAHWQIHNGTNGEGVSQVYFSNSSLATLASVDTSVKSMSKIFLIVGLVMTAFAMLLFSNFISTSITQKQHEIGILRAVGARGNDVFKIFFSESFFIALLCVVLSVAATVVLCDVINNELASGLGVSLLTFGPLSLLVLIAVALLTVVISTFLPVYNAARKKPVESIRAVV